MFILFASVLPFIPTLCILWMLFLHHVLGWIVLFPISSFWWEFLWSSTLLSLIPLHIFVSGWYKVPQPPVLRSQSPPSFLQNGLFLLKKSHYLSSFDFIKCNIPENSSSSLYYCSMLLLSFCSQSFAWLQLIWLQIIYYPDYRQALEVQHLFSLNSSLDPYIWTVTEC